MTIPQEIIDILKITTDTELKIIIDDEKIVLSKVKK